MTAKIKRRERRAAGGQNASLRIEPQGASASTVSNTYWVWVLAVALAVTTAAGYAAVRHHAFVTYDDPQYITDNPHILGGLTWTSVAWAFTAGHQANWHPLTWLSHMADVELFGLDAGAHHLTNLILHIVNALFLFFLLRWMTGTLWRSAFVAALFALHPLHVESVAWVAERKDVLSTFFWMLTLGAYVAYVRGRKRSWYLLTIALYACGLMAKPMLVTLPVILLLLDRWPLGRTDKSLFELVSEKAPLFVMAGVSSIVTFFVQRSGGAVVDLQIIPAGTRVANAIVSYVRYLVHTIAPTALAAPYPFPSSIPLWWTAGAVAVLAGVTVVAVRQMRKRPYVLVGWLWYLVMLLPVIGLIQVGRQSMADRYTYVPLVGIFIILSWGAWDFLSRWSSGRSVAAVAGGLVVVLCFAQTRSQVRHWANDLAFWSHTLAVTKNNYLAESAYCMTVMGQGRLDEAMAHCTRAITLEPEFSEAHLNMGMTVEARGDNDAALKHYLEALRIKPDAVAHNNVAVVLIKTGKTEEAVVHLKEAMKADPYYASPHNNMGVVLGGQNKIDSAIVELQEAVRLKPQYFDAHNNLGNAYRLAGRVNDAIREFEIALTLNPSSDAVRTRLAELREGK